MKTVLAPNAPWHPKPEKKERLLKLIEAHQKKPLADPKKRKKTPQRKRTASKQIDSNFNEWLSKVEKIK